ARLRTNGECAGSLAVFFCRHTLRPGPTLFPYTTLFRSRAPRRSQPARAATMEEGKAPGLSWKRVEDTLSVAPPFPRALQGSGWNTSRPLDEWPARTGTACSLRSLRAGRHEDRAIIVRPWPRPGCRPTT